MLLAALKAPEPSLLIRLENGEYWLEHQFYAARATREAHHKTRCVSPVARAPNGQQLPGNADGPIGVFKHATVMKRRRGFADDCGTGPKLEADFKEFLGSSISRNANWQIPHTMGFRVGDVSRGDNHLRCKPRHRNGQLLRLHAAPEVVTTIPPGG